MDESALKDPWHYPRPKLAEKYLKVFDIGLIAAQDLFAKRGMGKSEFLEKDLLPAAREHGNYWRLTAPPARRPSMNDSSLGATRSGISVCG